jgi:uncharacterized membrane protein YphA (DoxX/SURF4 family)
MNKPTSHGALVWIGRVITVLIAALFIMSAVGKLVGGEQLEKGIKHLELPDSMVLPLAILEITCAIIYLIPQTSVLGAILLTGYMGGAICTHWRVGDAFVPQILIPVFMWLGIYLRERGLWSLIPWRTQLRR